jgi:glycosyltransferase involved in cell wall biosynthesis
LQKIRIAYLSVIDPLDKRSWSGTTYYIGQALQKNIGDVDFLGPVKFPGIINNLMRGFIKLIRILFKKEYSTVYSIFLSWYSSRVFNKKIKGKHYDCIVAPAASNGLTHIKTNLPIISIADTTFHLISNYYLKDFKNLVSLSKWEGNYLDRKSLKKSSLIIYSSWWAANSAIKDYKIPESKVFVMPLGANIDFIPERGVIHEKEKNDTLTLLYLAVEWERKGGRIAFDAFSKLYEKGISVKLVICGCIPPPQFSHPNMEVIPFLDKNVAGDHERFVRLLSSAHFLILPTRADCSLLVACEANAYGVPAITTDTGGVSEIVKDGINGYCLPLEASGEEYSILIYDLFTDKKKYHRLVQSSRLRFEESLNWDKWADGFRELYQAQLLSQPKINEYQERT